MSQQFCKACGTEIAEGMKFCRNCGTAVAEPSVTPPPAAPFTPQQPYPPYPYGQPPYYVVQKPVRPGRGFGIAAMVLGIIGVVYSFIIFTAVLSTSGFSRLISSGMGMAAIVYSVFGILAVTFGTVSRNRGYRCGVSMSGLVMGVITLAFCLIALLVSVAS